MNKLLIACATALIALAACKKKTDTDYATTNIVTPSYPTITFSAPPFVSINTGGSIPSVAATAYDSTLGESYPVSLVGTDDVNNQKPGLYVIQAKATNKYGYFTTSAVYVAVTNVSPTVHLEGQYVRAATGYKVKVTRWANGLYSISNFFGVSGLDADAYFAHLNDTTIVVPPQETELGHLETSNNKLKMAPGDTTISFVLQTLTSNRTTRVFKKL